MRSLLLALPHPGTPRASILMSVFASPRRAYLLALALGSTRGASILASVLPSPGGDRLVLARRSTMGASILVLASSMDLYVSALARGSTTGASVLEWVLASRMGADVSALARGSTRGAYRLASLLRSTMRALILALTPLVAPRDVGGQGSIPSVQLTAAAYREDVAAFRAIVAGDRSFTPAARSEVERRLAILEGALDTVGRAWFEVELTRLVALADNGHTNAQAASRSARFNRIPVRLTPFGGGFYALRARGQHTDLLGAQLVAVDGRPVEQLRPMVHTLTGGAVGWRDRFAPYALESPQLLHTLGAIAQAGAATYRFRLADGRTVDRRIVADAADVNRPRNGTARWMFPDVALPNEGEGWRSLSPVDRSPWALQDIAVPFRWRDAPELGAMVIELRQTANAPGRPIAAFLAEVDAELRRRRPTHVVLDMRINGGGDLNTTRDFMKALPTLVPGRVFVLTSPYTFSAAISSVGYLEQAAPDRVSIVGELVGDRLEFWAEGGPGTLPNSGMVIGRATERHDYVNGCRGYTDCHGPVVRNPISVRSLAPDIAAPWTIQAYRAGRDPAMEAVAAALR